MSPSRLALVRIAAASDPAGFLSRLDKPVVIDEVQRTPELLLAIKEDVDRNRQPGRYLLTGSANVLTLPLAADSLAAIRGMGIGIGMVKGE